MKPGEMNGREFHFISREEMEEYISNGKMLEYGETKGHLYGLSVKTVKKTIETGKIPILDLHPQVNNNNNNNYYYYYYLLLFIGS